MTKRTGAFPPSYVYNQSITAQKQVTCIAFRGNMQNLFQQEKKVRFLRSGKNIFFLILTLLLIGFASLGIYLRAQGAGWADWTGFGPYADEAGNMERGKTLWDWLELLIIPTFLALGAIFFNRQERTKELRLAEQRRIAEIEAMENHNQEVVLQNYLDKMSELVLEKHLLQTSTQRQTKTGINVENSTANMFPENLEAVLKIAQVYTVTVLRHLNSYRRNTVFRFLQDAGLSETIFASASLDSSDLSNAQLSKANLSRANLREANLRMANLSEVNAQEAYMNRADLQGSNLKQANLSDAHLGEANLTHTNLRSAFLNRAHMGSAILREAALTGAELNTTYLANADLSGADLTGANLSSANLGGANFSAAKLKHACLYGAYLEGALVTFGQLATASTLEGATMPDGKKYDPSVHRLE